MSKLTRIEKVKKICQRCKGTGRITWHNKQAGREFEGLDYEIPCPDCQLFPQPLDDKELREKALLTDKEVELLKVRCRYPVGDEGRIGRTGVESRAKFYSTDNKKLHKLIAKAQQDKDFALLQQKIEEAKREEKERLIKFLRERNEESGLPFILALEGRK